MWTATTPVEVLLTVREVTALLRVSTWTIYALAARQELPHVRVSNVLRFRAEDVQRFLRRRN
jgi:excisionase family DNA binding protein